MLRAPKAWFSTHRAMPGVALLALTTLNALAATPEPTLRHDSELGCAACRNTKRSFLLMAPPASRSDADRAANLTDTDVLHYDLNIEIIPSTHNIAGSNTITVASLVDGLDHFEIRLSNSFTISTIKVAGTPVAWSRTDSIHVNVPLDRIYNSGEQFDVYVDYSGPANDGGFGSIVWSYSAGLPFVYTLSETYYAYTWWPTKDDNTDKATADLTFTIPDTVYLVSNGLLVSDTPVAGNKRQFHYHTDYQTATYLFQFSLGDYHTFSGSHPYPGGVMPLEFALLSGDDTTTNRNAFLKTENILPVFDDLYGLYPFINEKYGIYEFGFGGGMEHQTMTGQGTTSVSVTAHELSHQWWGDMVTCATWNDIWLNEGFATYSEALWNEFKGGSDDLAALQSSMSARTPSTISQTVYVPDITDINRVFNYDSTYLKGAWVLHMLRGLMGDQNFFDTLAAYRAAYEYGAATTLEFQGVAESVSGLDLSTFFDQWIFQPGRVDYRTAFSNYSINGQNYVDVYFRQVQDGSYPTYQMPVTLRFTTGAGTYDTAVFNDTRNAHYFIPTPAPATAIDVDPDRWIFRGNNTFTTYLPGAPRIVETSPAPGAFFDPTPPAQITVTFHRDVQISGADVSLTGQSGGPIATSFAYDAPSHTLTLTPTLPLTPDTYTVTVLDSVLDASTGSPLDGEIADDTLPSGDGAAGGDASFSFQYAPSYLCAGDVDGDNDTDIYDFGDFATNFGLTSGATRTQGDLDGSGSVNVFDFSILVSDFGCGTEN